MFSMPSFLGVTQLSFRSYGRSSLKSKRKTQSISNDSSNTNILINSAETPVFSDDALPEDLEPLVQCTTPLAFDNEIFTEQQNLNQQEINDPLEVPMSSLPDIVPIFHPNEVLLQRFPNKTSMKRPSEIRLHKIGNTTVNKNNNNINSAIKNSRKSNATPQSSNRSGARNSSTAQLTTTRRFRSSSLIEHLTRISNRNSNNADTSFSNDPLDDDTTLNPLTNLTNNAFSTNSFNTQASTSNLVFATATSAANTNAQVALEISHQYLTRNCTPGTLYVTTERLLFVPNNAPSAAPPHPQFDILISAIDTMKAVQSDLGQWYFLCYEGPYVCTIPFKTHSRVRSFLRLIANIRFEQMVRRSLPPKYASAAGVGRACGCVTAAARPDVCSVMCSVCAGADIVDWNDEDERLPTYSESEEAVRQHLVSLGLLAEDCPFDRQNSTFDVIGMLAQACLPPNRDRQPGFRETPHRRNSDPNRAASGSASFATRRASVPQPRPLTLQRRLGAYDERIYEVPLVWI